MSLKKMLLFFSILATSASMYAQSYNKLTLSKYVFSGKATAGALVAKLIYAGNTSDAQLMPKAKVYLSLNKGALYLTAAGAKRLVSKKLLPIALTIKGSEGETVVNYTLITDEFSKDKIVAHRGAWKKLGLPQNSIASLKQAVTLGCQGSEFDVHLTADEVLVINHDPVFEGIKIETATYQQLLEKKLSNGESIPTLDAYLKEGMKQRITKLYLEIKPSAISKERGQKVAEKVMAMVHNLQAQGWVNYISFDHDILKRVLQIEPSADVAFLDGLYAPDKLKQDGMNADYHYSVFQKNPDWMPAAHKLGVSINAWTANDPEVIKWLIAGGADLITTNEPELTAELLKAK